MPGMSGDEMSHVIKLRSASTAVLMLTGNPPSDQSCLDVVLHKPIHLMRLKEAVEEVLSGSVRLPDTQAPSL